MVRMPLTYLQYTLPNQETLTYESHSLKFVYIFLARWITGFISMVKFPPSTFAPNLTNKLLLRAVSASPQCESHLLFGWPILPQSSARTSPTLTRSPSTPSSTLAPALISVQTTPIRPSTSPALLAPSRSQSPRSQALSKWALASASAQ
jgi:hypothetical protein